MKKLFFATIIAISTISGSQAATPPDSFADLVDKLSPAVVNISTTQVVKGFDSEGMGAPAFPPGSPFEEFNDLLNQQYKAQKAKPRKATSLGSGFIIDKSGIIVTNNHVVEGGTDITVTLQDNTELKAKVLGRDPKVDIAVLKVSSTKELPFVSFGNSDTARVGDWIIAIGNPYGLGGSVSAGIISARGRDIHIGAFDDFLQTDAAINRGNSGGPMFNMAGEVIGVNSAIFSPSGNGGNVGIGFALPSSLVKPIIEQIVKYGKVKRAWLGVQIQGVTEEIANSLGLPEADGALVLSADPKGPAAKAGIKEGDVIASFDGKKVEAMRKLPRIVAETEIGKKVEVTFYRNGKLYKTNAVLMEMVDTQQKAAAGQGRDWPNGVYVEKSRIMLGMKLIEINPSVQRAYKVKIAEGLLIAGINLSSPVADSGIKDGEVIIKAGQYKSKSFADLDRAIAEAKAGGKKSVLLMVTNGKTARFVGLPIE